MAKTAMTDEQKANLIRANKERSAKIAEWRANPALVAGKWRIQRLDEDNWGLTDKDPEQGDWAFYPTFEYAVRGLLDQKIGEHVLKTPHALLIAIERAKNEVLQALGGNK